MSVKCISEIKEELKRIYKRICHGSRLLEQALRLSHLIGHNRDKLAQSLVDVQSGSHLQRVGATDRELSRSRCMCHR